ncbi:MAG TPA: NUDIX domain-containing protein [Acidimicrobiales bacterium]|nr:NUDIX domain-containing protein [Acidimicrobiales bacterium]
MAWGPEGASTARGAGRAMHASALATVLATYSGWSDEEARDLDRIRALTELAGSGGDPWARSSPLHVTGSAVVVHPPSRRVLLRWHDRQQGWLQVGGHADPGEADPFAVALREAREETALTDLAAWPDPARPQLVHAVIVPVPAGRIEPAHEHADLRYVLATSHPDDAAPESPEAALRWLSFDEALDAAGEDNLRITLERIDAALAAA